MSKARINIIANYFNAERKARVAKLLQDLQIELNGLPDPSEDDLKDYFKLSGDEKRLIRERYPIIAAHPDYVPAKFKFADIANDINDGEMLEMLAAALGPLAQRCDRCTVIAYAEAYWRYADFVDAVQLAVENREPGAVELLPQIVITTARTEAAARTRHQNAAKKDNGNGDTPT